MKSLKSLRGKGLKGSSQPQGAFFFVGGGWGWGRFGCLDVAFKMEIGN